MDEQVFVLLGLEGPGGTGGGGSQQQSRTFYVLLSSTPVGSRSFTWPVAQSA